MKISSAFPSTYLKAADLQGRAITVIMDRVEMQDIGGELKPVLYFQGKDRGLVLNITNANKISEVFGDPVEPWKGEAITLYEAMVEFQGRTVPAIRVRLAPRKSNVDAPARQQPPKQSSAEIIDDDIPF